MINSKIQFRSHRHGVDDKPLTLCPGGIGSIPSFFSLSNETLSCGSIIYFTVAVCEILKIAIRGDGKSPDQKVIDMQLQAANLVYIFDVIILSVTANKSGRLTVEL